MLTDADIGDSFVLIECFMEYIPDMFGDDSGLSQINYHFKDKSLSQFQEEFKKDLNALNDAHMAERDFKGNKVHLHGLEKIAQSIRD